MYTREDLNGIENNLNEELAHAVKAWEKQPSTQSILVHMSQVPRFCFMTGGLIANVARLIDVLATMVIKMDDVDREGTREFIRLSRQNLDQAFNRLDAEIGE
jgi:enoyl-CoA hydratase/carnithine racemase